MKTAKEQAEDIRSDKKLLEDIKETMSQILHDELSTDRDKIRASEVLLKVREVMRYD